MFIRQHFVCVCVYSCTFITWTFDANTTSFFLLLLLLVFCFKVNIVYWSNFMMHKIVVFQRINILEQKFLFLFYFVISSCSLFYRAEHKNNNMGQLQKKKELKECWRGLCKQIVSKRTGCMIKINKLEEHFKEMNEWKIFRPTTEVMACQIPESKTSHFWIPG